MTTALFTLWLQAVNVSGSAATGFPSLLILVTQTQFGRVWLARLALLIIIAILLIGQTQKHTSTLFLGAGFMLSACFLVASAFAGHAAAADGAESAFQLSADGMHLLAGGVWLGGLLPLACLLREYNREGVASSLAVTQETTRRFSNLALASMILLIGTGVYNAWKLVGGFVPLFGTAYGELLLIKLALLLPLIGIGAINRLRLKPTITKTSDRAAKTRVALRRVSRNVVIEIALGVMILLIVGHIARHAAGAPCSTRMAVFISLGLVDS